MMTPDRKIAPLPWLILFLAAAAIFGLQGCNQSPVTVEVYAQVQFTPWPEGLVRTAHEPKMIHLTVTGPPNPVQKLQAAGLTYLVDLYSDIADDPAGIMTFLEPGLYTIPVIEERFPIPRRVRVQAISPSFISVRLDRALTKKLPVTVPYDGSPAAGYLARPAETEPPAVELTGAESVLETMTVVQTKPVDLSGARETFKKKVPLALGQPGAIQDPARFVTVTVPIDEEIVERSFDAVPVAVLNGRQGASIQPSSIDVTVKGPSNRLKTGDMTDLIEVYIDVQGMETGVYVRRAVIKLPVGMMLTAASPEVFTVTIK